MLAGCGGASAGPVQPARQPGCASGQAPALCTRDSPTPAAAVSQPKPRQATPGLTCDSAMGYRRSTPQKLPWLLHEGTCPGTTDNTLPAAAKSGSSGVIGIGL